MKLCFVTVGATASFEKLLEQVLSSKFLETLAERHYTHLLIQYGKNGEKIYQSFLDSEQSHHGVTLGGFDFKPTIEREMMMTAERENRQQERGLIICHAGMTYSIVSPGIILLPRKLTDI
jgi:beta-1,4-N-acetylglucosaminyltransferase